MIISNVDQREDVLIILRTFLLSGWFVVQFILSPSWQRRRQRQRQRLVSRASLGYNGRGVSQMLSK